VDGSSMLEIIKKKGPMAVERAAQYIWQSAHGLDHAARVGVIHRDIKPGNILIDRTGAAKILDMGLARFYHSDDDMLTKKYDEKSVLGTADYVAPEQTINSHDVDVRADIYSLGATFYYLLAGHPPFPEGTISQKLIAHQTRQPVPIRNVRAEVPAGLAAVLERMMAKSISERYQSPAEVCAALAPFIPAEMAPPPEEEMPVLSPAARENSNQGGSSSGSASGSFTVDAIAGADFGSRVNTTVATNPRMSGMRPRPAAVAVGPSKVGGAGGPVAGGTSSGNMQPAYYEPPPMVSPLG